MSTPATPIDWDALRETAIAAAERAYAPYSGYRVGAAALAADGRVVSGCNIENASYGVTLCAECSLVSELHMGGGGKLVAFICVNGDGETIMPCGRCRQLLIEHAVPGMLVAAAVDPAMVTEPDPTTADPATVPDPAAVTAEKAARQPEIDTATATTTGEPDATEADTAESGLAVCTIEELLPCAFGPRDVTRETP